MEGDRGGGSPAEKAAGRGTGVRGTGGGKRDSQGGGKREKLGKIMQHYAKLCNQERANR